MKSVGTFIRIVLSVFIGIVLLLAGGYFIEIVFAWLSSFSGVEMMLFLSLTVLSSLIAIVFFPISRIILSMAGSNFKTQQNVTVLIIGIYAFIKILLFREIYGDPVTSYNHPYYTNRLSFIIIHVVEFVTLTALLVNQIFNHRTEGAEVRR